MLTLPNILTFIRILLIPVFVGLFYYPSLKTNLMAAIVFIIAALTDFVDGYLARKLKQTTKFGAFLDPVADKIIVCTALVLIVEYYSVHVGDFFPHINLCVTLPSIVIIAREIVVSALREWMAEIGQRARVAVNWVGKWKTAIQMIAIAGLIWRYNDLMIYAALFMLQVATVLTIMSMIMYLKVGLAHMFEDKAAVSAEGAAAGAAAAADAAKTAAPAPVPAESKSEVESTSAPEVKESAPVENGSKAAAPAEAPAAAPAAEAPQAPVASAQTDGAQSAPEAQQTQQTQEAQADAAPAADQSGQAPRQ